MKKYSKENRDRKLRERGNKVKKKCVSLVVI